MSRPILLRVLSEGCHDGKDIKIFLGWVDKFRKELAPAAMVVDENFGKNATATVTALQTTAGLRGAKLGIISTATYRLIPTEIQVQMQEANGMTATAALRRRKRLERQLFDGHASDVDVEYARQLAEFATTSEVDRTNSRNGVEGGQSGPDARIDEAAEGEVAGTSTTRTGTTG